MKSSRLVSLAAAVLFALSSATANAGFIVVPPTGNSNTGIPAGIWILFGCSGTIIFTAFVKHHRHHRELTPLEASTCGFAYWFNPQNHP